MDILAILSDPTKHTKIEDHELYTFLTQYLDKYKSFNILNRHQEKGVCEAIKIRLAKTPGLPKTREFINGLFQQLTSEEDKKSSIAELFRRAGRSATASVETVKEVYRRKIAANGNTPLTEADIILVIKYMCSNFSDFETTRQEPWNAENFGKATAQLVSFLISFR